MNLPTRCLLALLAMGLIPIAAAAAASTPAQAVRRAVPLLQRSARTWTRRAACTSCHHQGMALVAIDAAREGGFAVDRGEHRRQERAITADRGRRILQMYEGVGTLNPQAVYAFFLFSFGAANRPPDALTDAMASQLLLRQAADGGWVSESHRPPMEDARETVTAMAVRGLRLYAPGTRRAEVPARLRRARRWLLERSRPWQHEGRVMRLLGLIWSDAPRAAVRDAAATVRAHQRADGGWEQFDGRGSDAYATATSLVALRAAGIGPDDRSIRRGEAFLCRTQRPDGSWRVPTRHRGPGLPYFETGFPHGVDQFVSYPATAWAVAALSRAGRTGPPTGIVRPAVPPRAASPSQRPFAADPALDRLFHALALGTAAQARAALDDGADPNGRGRGGATPLHWAVSDPVKTRLLLERGAAPDARNGEGETPLAVAARLDGGLGALRLLLASGASPDATAPDTLSPLANAALAVDREKVEALLTRGAALPTTGDPYATAPGVASYTGDASLTGLLLARVSPTERGKLGELLIDALLAGDEAMVRTLLAAGVDPNAPDRDGRTPLHWAAWCGSGHDRLVDALLAAGADPSRRTKDGRTARDLARESGNRSVARRLARPATP